MMKRQKNFWTLRQALTAVAVFALPLLVLAQEHAAEHSTGTHAAPTHNGLPTVVYLQAINFVMYAGLLVYFMRKPVREYFTGRKERFNSALNKAAQAKAEAEAQKREVQSRIDELTRSSQAELARAKSEAQELQARIMKEAEEISAHLKNEAARTTTFEIERAKNALRESLLQQSVAFSSTLLKEKMAEGDQKRLQTEFVDKIGANR
jgi:F-type H+-transporting ATPase subunit b